MESCACQSSRSTTRHSSNRLKSKALMSAPFPGQLGEMVFKAVVPAFKRGEVLCANWLGLARRSCSPGPRFSAHRSSIFGTGKLLASRCPKTSIRVQDKRCPELGAVL